MKTTQNSDALNSDSLTTKTNAPLKKKTFAIVNMPSKSIRPQRSMVKIKSLRPKRLIIAIKNKK